MQAYASTTLALRLPRAYMYTPTLNFHRLPWAAMGIYVAIYAG